MNNLKSHRYILHTGDQLEHYNMTAGYHVMGYFAAVAGKIHFLTATDDRIKVDWPSKDREFSFRRQQRHHIVQSVVETLSGTRNAFTRVTFTLDIISYLADIIAPKLRIAGVGALLSPAEIDELCRTADGILIIFNISNCCTNIFLVHRLKISYSDEDVRAELREQFWGCDVYRWWWSELCQFCLLQM